MPAPILRVEMEHMRTAFSMMFNEQQVVLDEQFQAALTEALKPEKVQRILNEAADRELKSAIDDEVRKFFTLGEGRVILARHVIARLKETYDL